MSRNEERDRIRHKIQDSNIEDHKLVVIPAAETPSLADESVEKRVCAYCRVSTDDPAQTTSYELQKKHYAEQIDNTPGWKFAGIYADEGISATSLKNRDEFNRMIEDCNAGKIDVIVTKNVSRFARNVVDCISIVRKLAQLNPPVGVKFENEGFFSLDNTSEMILTVLAAAAQEESKTKSNSMNWSLEKRFDNCNFLTPVLLGYDHDEDGNLIVNQEEALSVRLMFFTYLAGFPLSEIAELLMELKRPTKKGNMKWTSNSVRAILSNERYCGNVLSWKTYTYDFWEHKKRKNRHNRKQVLEIDHHEGIVSHEIFEAVQAKLQSDKFARNHRPFPTLDVVDDGALRGFVPVNRFWRGFTDQDYISASESVYNKDQEPAEVSEKKGASFYLDGYEIVRSDFFTTAEKLKMTFGNGQIRFNTLCLKKFENVEYVEILLNTVEKCIAIRPCDKDSPNAIRWGKQEDDRWISTPRSISGFSAPLFEITGWSRKNKYRLCGQYISDGDEQMILFDLTRPQIIRMIQTGELEVEVDEQDSPDTSGASVEDAERNDTPDQERKVIPIMRFETCFSEEWEDRFGSSPEEASVGIFERIRYQGDWEILRPARLYKVAGGVSEAVLREVETESQKMLEEMRCAV